MIEIEEHGVRIEGETGQCLIACDTVVLAIGVRPNDGLLCALKETGLEIHRVGDCGRCGNMLEAVRDAYEVASTI